MFNLPQDHIVSLNFSLNILTYPRGCGFNPHSPHLFFLHYFSPNSLIYSRGCGFNRNSSNLFLFSFIFLLTLSSAKRLGVRIPTVSPYLIYIFSLPSHSTKRLWLWIQHTSFLLFLYFILLLSPHPSKSLWVRTPFASLHFLSFPPNFSLELYHILLFNIFMTCIWWASWVQYPLTLSI